MFEAVGTNVFAGGFTEGVKKHFRVACHLEEPMEEGTLTYAGTPPTLGAVGPEPASP